MDNDSYERTVELAMTRLEGSETFKALQKLIVMEIILSIDTIFPKIKELPVIVDQNRELIKAEQQRLDDLKAAVDELKAQISG